MLSLISCCYACCPWFQPKASLKLVVPTLLQSDNCIYVNSCWNPNTNLVLDYLSKYPVGCSNVYFWIN